MTEQTEKERLAARYVVPPVTTPSTRVDPMHPLVPRSVRGAFTAAQKAGLAPELYRACGTRLDAAGAVLETGAHTLGIKVRTSRGRLVVMVWRFKQATEKAPAAWVFYEGFLRPGRVHEIEGAPYQLLMEKVNHDEAREVLGE